MEERVVEVGFCAYRIESAAVPGTDFLDEVCAEGCSGFVGLGVVEVDLEVLFSGSACGDVVGSL